ncbi:MAG: hypothetical protein ABJA66_06120 [Actinomycetota bacterium]
MRLKITIIFVVLFLSFGYTNAVGTNTKTVNIGFVSEVEKYRNEANEEKIIELKLENGSAVNCLLRAKNSNFQNVGDGKIAVSINSNWICK